jgi:gamma-glutamylaminecyclotransferase
MPAYLFVYGTLLRGECRQDRLAGEEFVGAAATAPEYRLYDVGEYPALVVADRGTSIAGELWLVGDEALRELDDVEGVDEGLYARQPVRLLPPYDRLRAETYVYMQSVTGLAEIGPGWRDR